MRKSKSWAPSRGGAACADTPEDRDGCCCDAATPGGGDSCAVNDSKLSRSVASIQIERAFMRLTRKSSATTDGSEVSQHRQLSHKIKAGRRAGSPEAGWLERLVRPRCVHLASCASSRPEP